MQIARLRQRDGTTCGPAVAVMAAALLDPGYRPVLAAQGRFSDEQLRVHASINLLWPRRLGTTPSAVARAITILSGGTRYRWRLWWGRRDAMSDVLDALDAGRPVAMLVGRVIPRHWVLVVDVAGEMLECYEPSSGELRVLDLDAVRFARLTNVGYPRPFAFVLPRLSTRSATA